MSLRRSSLSLFVCCVRTTPIAARCNINSTFLLALLPFRLHTSTKKLVTVLTALTAEFLLIVNCVVCKIALVSSSFKPQSWEREEEGCTGRRRRSSSWCYSIPRKQEGDLRQRNKPETLLLRPATHIHDLLTTRQAINNTCLSSIRSHWYMTTRIVWCSEQSYYLFWKEMNNAVMIDGGCLVCMFSTQEEEVLVTFVVHHSKDELQGSGSITTHILPLSLGEFVVGLEKRRQRRKKFTTQKVLETRSTRNLGQNIDGQHQVISSVQRGNTKNLPGKTSSIYRLLLTPDLLLWWTRISSYDVVVLVLLRPSDWFDDRFDLGKIMTSNPLKSQQHFDMHLYL